MLQVHKKLALCWPLYITACYSIAGNSFNNTYDEHSKNTVG